MALLLLACLSPSKPSSDGPNTQKDSATSTDSGQSTDSGNGDSADSDSDSDPARPIVTSVSPPYGTTLGGQEVTLIGSHLGGVTEVMFGKSPGTLKSVGDQQVIVVAPAEIAAAVDLTISDGTQSTTLPTAYTYYTDGTGAYGTFGSFTYSHFVGTGWKSPVQDGAMAVLYPLLATTSSHWGDLYAPSLDTCVSEFTPSFPLSVVSTPTADDLVVDDGAPFPVPWTTQNGVTSWLAEDLTGSEWQPGTSYTLHIPTVSIYPSVDVPLGLQTPDRFTIDQPDLSALPSVAQNDLSLAWSGGNPGDSMVLSLDLYDAADSAIVEAVTCVVQDDGAFTVPASVWTGWEPGRSLVVVLGRVQESVATLPYNNSTSGMVGIYQELGVAITE